MMKWITRARPKIDRIACPWLVARFIDQDAEFLYVPAQLVFRRTQESGAIPFDVPGAELGLSRVFSDDHDMLRHGAVGPVVPGFDQPATTKSSNCMAAAAAA